MKHKYLFKLRHYPEGSYVSVWLVRRAGKGLDAGLLTGQVLPRVALELAKALGLDVEEETSPLPGGLVTPRAGCAPVSVQQELFGEQP